MRILLNQARSSRQGPGAYFTGRVWIDEIVIGTAPSKLKANRVSFEPGARTAWHTHPVGQALHVLTGLGRVQLQGSSPQRIGPGDTVWIEAGEVHWHGAEPGRTMVHLAIQEADEHGTDVIWMEQVTDEEYLAPAE
ncbi:Transcriptional regulator [Acidisarcina polymorpha]|uniref:Transcriptional regulator n=1 Tax=Acidisarcina polymorpha TaxID=2211140 RepID=A0A2Z5G8E1_9BACT|nr:cupin domain-containing protein [Acidisarcina polymorpha]AXC15228.1 Transcriptional regulator [Acidisarcina polymorpha]